MRFIQKVYLLRYQTPVGFDRIAQTSNMRNLNLSFNFSFTYTGCSKNAGLFQTTLVLA